MTESKDQTAPHRGIRALDVVLRACGLVLIVQVLSLLFLNAFQALKAPSPSAASVRAQIKPPRDSSDPRELYLELLKRTLTRYQFAEPYQLLPQGRLRRLVYTGARAILANDQLEIVRVVRFSPRARESGEDIPLEAETMIGLKRLDNLESCITDVLKRQIPGDFIECGAWRGGACIFMRAVLKAYGDTTRTVWAADSFEGLPKPDRSVYPESLFSGGEMAVALEEVQRNFMGYGMLDGQVRFLKGLFADTLPKAPIKTLALLRLDGDLYESTLQPLDILYDRVSPGGYIIADDWNLPSARKAVQDFRSRRGITEPILAIDNSGVYWQKSR